MRMNCSRINVHSLQGRHNHVFAGRRSLDSLEALTYTKASSRRPKTMTSFIKMHIRIAPRFVALSLLVMSVPSFALPATPDQNQITFDQIPSPNNGRVNAIVRDDRGFLWFGTTKGLYKYDGYRVRVFPGESPEVGLVFALLRMDDGSLLLGTGRGLWRFDLTTERATPYLTGRKFSGSRIISMTMDPDGTLWVGTSSEGLFSYNPVTQEEHRYTADKGLGDNRITCLLSGYGHTLWIGTGAGGLNALDLTTGRIVQYRRQASRTGSLNSDQIVSLCERDGRELWIGTDVGLNILDLVSGHMSRMDIHSPITHTIMSIAGDPSGRMWVAATDLGLLSYSHGSFTRFRTSADGGRTLNAVMVLYPDPVATTPATLLLWVGTRSGVDKVLLSTNPFENHLRDEQSLRLNRGAVLALCEDRKGLLWVGLWGGGLDVFQHGHGQYQRVGHFEHDALNAATLPANDVEDIMEDRNENLWIGTFDGLAMLDPSRKHMTVDRHVERESLSLASNTVSRIYEDQSGTIWICTRGGLSQLMPGNPHRFRSLLNHPEEAHPAGGNEVTDILDDSLSNLWVTTSGNGLIRIEEGRTFTRFMFPGDSAGTQENWMYTLATDRHGGIWISTRAGLIAFDSRSRAFTRYPTDRFHDEHIFGMEFDQANNLWLSTGIGLGKFSPATGTSVRYERDDGIPFTELRSSFHRSSRGTLFVGGLDGFTEFCPESVATTRPPPPIAITGFSILDIAMPASVFGAPEIDLAYDQKSFSFSFAALDYTAPERNSYAYRMVGLDAGWVNAGNRTYASYTNLDPGNYVFQVKGSNSDDVWNEKGTSIRIRVSPPYWQTWWFRSALVILFASVTYSAYRYRLRGLLDLERLRLRIANDLHDDVGSNLSAIAMASRTLQRAPELAGTTRQKLAEIYDTAVLTSEGMKDLVWLIKPENDTLDDLFLRMKDTALTLLGDVSVEFHSPDVLDSTTIGIDFKRSVFLAFKEIITNIAKHSKASVVEIRVALQDHVFELVVSDDGTGFDTTAHHRGNGLQSLRKRAEHIGGSCTITSVPHSGTTVVFCGKM